MSSVLNALYMQVERGAVFKYKAAAYQVEKKGTWGFGIGEEED